jgi:hypothetical protein
MMNRYQHQHPQTHNSNTTLPSNHHFHLSNSTTTTTTTVLQTPIDNYSSNNNNSIVDIHQQNHYNLLDDNYIYNPPPSYCTKHQQIYRSPTICTLDSQPPVYETYTSSSTTTNIPVNTYEQFCIDNSQTSPSSSSWVATTSDGTIYHPIQSFDQCNIYLNNSQLSEQNYRDYSSIPLSNNETSSSSTSSSSSFNNPQQQQQQYRHIEQSSTLPMDEKTPAIVASEAKYKWMQIKRTPAKTAGKIFMFYSRTYVKIFSS